MEELILSKQGMTSLEIAEVTGKLHAHVMRDIKNLIDKGVHESNFGLMFRISKLGNGAERKDPYYNLTPKGCLILASGYDPVLREKIINRLIEDERKLSMKEFDVPQTFSDALMLAAKQQKQIEEQQKAIELKDSTISSQQKTIEEQKPSVTFTNAVSGSQSACLIGELAKLICQNGVKIGQNRLFEWMREKHYLGTSGEHRNMPNQEYIEQGLFVIKKGVRTGNDGVLYTTKTPKVTGKGQVYFINKFLNDVHA